jgi:hypothetical protein
VGWGDWELVGVVELDKVLTGLASFIKLLKK